MNLFKGLLGAGVGFLTGGPAGAVVGGLGGLDDSAERAQRKALARQGKIADQQAGMYGQVSPQYLALLRAYEQHAGINGTPIPGMSPYSGITNAQLGPYANPTDALRLRAAEDQANAQARQALGQFTFGMGRRGLGNSSFSAAGRAAILADAARNKSNFGRQLAIQAPQEYERRLGMYTGALNPGLGAGPTAAQIYGNQGAVYGNEANAQNASTSQALSNLMYYNALRNAQRDAYIKNFGQAYMGGDFAGV